MQIVGMRTSAIAFMAGVAVVVAPATSSAGSDTIKSLQTFDMQSSNADHSYSGTITATLSANCTNGNYKFKAKTNDVTVTYTAGNSHGLPAGTYKFKAKGKESDNYAGICNVDSNAALIAKVKGDGGTAEFECLVYWDVADGKLTTNTKTLTC